MFYFEEYLGKKVLRNDLLKDINAFFTTREGFVFDEIKADRIITPTQTHSDHIERVDARDRYPNTDALILRTKNIGCVLRFADCSPIILYNPEYNIAGIVHAGWRGTAAKITPKTVAQMGGNPKDIIAVIGPTIGCCCYEVSFDVKDLLLTTVKDTTGLFEGMNVDLKGINERQLRECGVEKIEVSEYCTSCNNDLFYSYRKENGTTERHFAFVML